MMDPQHGKDDPFRTNVSRSSDFWSRQPRRFSVGAAVTVAAIVIAGAFLKLNPHGDLSFNVVLAIAVAVTLAMVAPDLFSQDGSRSDAGVADRVSMPRPESPAAPPDVADEPETAGTDLGSIRLPPISLDSDREIKSKWTPREALAANPWSLFPNIGLTVRQAVAAYVLWLLVALAVHFLFAHESYSDMLIALLGGYPFFYMAQRLRGVSINVRGMQIDSDASFQERLFADTAHLVMLLMCATMVVFSAADVRSFQHWVHQVLGF